MKKTICVLSLWLASLSVCISLLAAEGSLVPGQLQYGGRLELAADAAQGLQGVTFALFGEQTGGAALWLETQNVSVDASGAYSTLLGAATEGGIPQDIFASGEARWLEVSYTSADGSVVTQPRVLLVSVPYALKAGDAQTLGGLPASAFVLNTDAVASRVNDAGGLPGATINEVLPAAAVSGTGTAGKITKWLDGVGTLGDSIITEAGGKIGINAAAPAAPLQVGSVGGLIPTSWAALINGRLGLINGNQSTYFVQQDGVGELSTYDYGTNQGMPLALNMNGGNVGVGTITPKAQFHVGPPAGANIPNNWTALVNGRFGFVLGDKSTYFVQQGGWGELSTFDYGTATGMPLALNMNGGNVGIGTTAPAAKLDVNGGVKMTAFTLDTGGKALGKVLKIGRAHV